MASSRSAKAAEVVLGGFTGTAVTDGYTAYEAMSKSRPVVDGIYAWITTEPALPKSLLGKAIGYTQRLWPGLVRFVEDARLALDRNAVERGMRAPALGRKNHHGSRSMRGTKVAGAFYGLVESAKLAGVDPVAYLREAVRRAIANPGTVTLPHDLLSD